ncbi:unnamed protein product [Aureobasidium mustum]|uniref:Uncharacterized protein n=1 Tax=Aureobasidium mustum TaxID=2773714 RepID=A0A9N8K6W5_9PEZI|nr:unnamed protein product [Aureobasidium mustum]
MSYNLGDLAGIHELILANYRVVDSENTDAILVVTLRKKNEEELLSYPAVTYATEDMFEAVLITHPSKGKKILMKESSPWNTPQPALIKLFEKTCKMLGDMMSSDYK